jgi:hypothetical protein
MEGSLRTVADKDQSTGDTGGRIREIDCRTATCKVVLEASDEVSLTKSVRMFSISTPGQVNLLGDRGGKPGELTQSMFIGFAKEYRDIEANQRAYAALRKQMLEELRRRHSGRPRLPDEPVIPAE